MPHLRVGCLGGAQTASRASFSSNLSLGFSIIWGVCFRSADNPNGLRFEGFDTVLIRFVVGGPGVPSGSHAGSSAGSLNAAIINRKSRQDFQNSFHVRRSRKRRAYRTVLCVHYCKMFT